jgi:hypothetical protein
MDWNCRRVTRPELPKKLWRVARSSCGVESLSVIAA